MAASFILDLIARAQLRAQLADVASETLGALSHGDTPARWSLTRAADVVSGAAFFAASSRIDDAGLHVESDGNGIEIGLVLGAPIDLARYRFAELTIDADVDGQLLLVTDHADGNARCVSAPTPFRRGRDAMRVDATRLDWRCDDGQSAAPITATMLRLRIEMPAGGHAAFTDAALRPPNGLGTGIFASLDTRSLDVPPDPAAVSSLAAIPLDRWAFVELAAHARVEPTLLAVDRIHAAAPAALVVLASDAQRVRDAASDWTPPQPAGRMHAILAWTALGLLAIALAWVRLHAWRSPRWQALAELAGSAGVPLGVLASGAIGDDFATPTLIALGCCVVFAASLLKGNAPRQPATRTWLRGVAVALASVALALLFISLLRDPGQPWECPSAARAVRYLGWAALQQFLISVIVAERFERLTGSANIAVLLSAFLFALLHAPNAMLMQFTFLGGLIWIWNWQHHRALLANTFAHAACGLMLATGMPPEWLRSAEIGARYFLF